jgi:hypothetical protein
LLTFEHSPWRGEDYKAGGLMIWGFSHHKQSDEDDDAGFTQRTIKDEALTGNHWFFNRIRRFFGDDDPKRFWHSVAFANTLPTTVPSQLRTSSGTPDQQSRVKARVERALREFAPSQAVLFSRKGWPMWPKFTGSCTEPAQVLMQNPRVEFGTYDLGLDHEVKTYGLPHPMIQSDEKMIAAVRVVLEH